MLKKLNALLVALIVSLSFIMTPAFAAATEPTNGTITVYNVPANYVVNAYQIVQANYDDDGDFLGWTWTDAVKKITVTTKDGDTETTSKPFDNSNYISQISLNDFNTIVEAISRDTASFTPTALTQGTEGSGDTAQIVYSNSSMPAGSYVIMAAQGEGATTLKVFNAMIASIGVESTDGNNVLVSGTLDSNGSLTTQDGILVNPDPENTKIVAVYAKASDVPLTKTHTVASEDEARDGASSSAQGQINDKTSHAEVITYTITTKTPDYRSAGYTNPKFSLTDTLSKGLTYESFSTKGNLSVTIGETTIDVPEDAVNEKYYYGGVEAFTVASTGKTEDNGGTLTIAFTEDFLKAFGSLDVKVTYNVRLNADAQSAFNPNPNTVTLTYSNDPSNSQSVNTIDDEDRIYTFTINGNLLVNGTSEKPTTAVDFIKTGKITTTKYETYSTKDYDPLAGAEFTLYSDAACTKVLDSDVTGEDGMMVFEDLGEGTYYLKETKAPKGYALDSQVIKVVIKATYDNAKPKNLLSYDITFTSKAYPNGITMTYKGTETKDTSGNSQYTIVRTSNDVGPTSAETSEVTYYAHLFENNNVSELPSTGSFGTYAFILIGFVIMAAAVTIFIQKRKDK